MATYVQALSSFARVGKTMRQIEYNKRNGNTAENGYATFVAVIVLVVVCLFSHLEIFYFMVCLIVVTTVKAKTSARLPRNNTNFHRMCERVAATGRLKQYVSCMFSSFSVK